VKKLAFSRSLADENTTKNQPPFENEQVLRLKNVKKSAPHDKTLADLGHIDIT